MKDFLDIEGSPKSAKKYIAIGIGAVVVVAIIIILILLLKTPIANAQSGVYAKLHDETIISNTTTFLLIGMRNPSDGLVIGKFEVIPDDASAISIKYPLPELLSFKLLPGESIERRLNVTGMTKAIRTDYEIKINILDKNNTIVGSTKVVLIVKRE